MPLLVKDFKQLAFNGLRYFKIRTKHRFQNLEDVIFPKAGLFSPWCITWSPLPLNLAKPKVPLTAVTFPLPIFAYEAAGWGPSFLELARNFWMKCWEPEGFLHCINMDLQNLTDKPDFLLWQPTSASRLAACELGVVVWKADQEAE